MRQNEIDGVQIAKLIDWNWRFLADENIRFYRHISIQIH